MNEPKHTPGPWMIDRHADNGELVVRCHSDKKIVANCQTDFYSSGSREKLMIEIQANAQLLAAAPEMLEALSRCKNELEELSFYLESQCIFGTWKATIEKARAAIAKATGEPQI